MGVYIEALILYMVLFLSYSVGQAPAEEIVVFSPAGELARIILYSVPSLALIWYLLLKSKSLKDWGIGPPNRKDLFVGLLALPSLMLIGFAIALISHYLSQTPPISGITAPTTILAWIILIFSCLSTGYLEESFFRFYLIARREEFGLSASRAILLSTLLFSLCHLYEGPWGFLNAVLSGIVLSFIFLRYRSFHAIALAHGLYNIFVYAFDALQLT